MTYSSRFLRLGPPLMVRCCVSLSCPFLKEIDPFTEGIASPLAIALICIGIVLVLVCVLVIVFKLCLGGGKR